MRVFLILISLLLVGCAEQQQKEPSYLKCDQKVFGVESFLWIVLDHENSLWTSSSFSTKPTEKDKNLFGVFARELYADEKVYWFKNDGNGKNYYLDRASLIYRGATTWQCEIIDDLSYLRNLGVEKARIKI